MTRREEQDAHDAGSPGTDAPQGPQCVLLSGSGDTPPELARLLERKGVAITSCANAYQAMGVIVRRAREAAASGRSPTVLLVVEPDTTPLSGELVRAVARSAPHVVCWRYAAGASPALGAFPPERPAVEVRPKPTVRPNPAPRAEPRLRLTGDPFVEDAVPSSTPGDGEDPPEETDGEATGRSGPVLTDEELRMLLSDESADEPRRERST